MGKRLSFLQMKILRASNEIEVDYPPKEPYQNRMTPFLDLLPYLVVDKEISSNTTRVDYSNKSL